MQAFVSPSGTAGKLTGKLILTDAQLSALIDWLTYANIHTTIHGEGEIRGQILPLSVTGSGTGGTGGGG